MYKVKILNQGDSNNSGDKSCCWVNEKADLI